MRPNTAPSPRSQKTPYPNDTVLPSFTNLKQLQDYIQLAVQAETSKLIPATQTKVSRYGPPALTQNAETLAAGEHTPRSTATTKPAGATQEDDVNTPDNDYQLPTVESCLFEAYHFNRDFRERTVPPFPEEDYRKADTNRKRTLQKTHSYRVKRASQPAAVQRQAKWDALIKRARKAARDGRVQNFSFFCFSLFSPGYHLLPSGWWGETTILKNLMVKIIATNSKNP